MGRASRSTGNASHPGWNKQEHQHACFIHHTLPLASAFPVSFHRGVSPLGRGDGGRADADEHSTMGVRALPLALLGALVFPNRLRFGRRCVASASARGMGGVPAPEWGLTAIALGYPSAGLAHGHAGDVGRTGPGRPIASTFRGVHRRGRPSAARSPDVAAGGASCSAFPLPAFFSTTRGTSTPV